MDGLALILCHKQATSARLRFARFGDSVIAVRLPATGGAIPHPGALLPSAASFSGIAPGDLRLDPDFEAPLLAPGGAVCVRLAEITTIDPPFDALQGANGRFITLTEIRGLPDTERDVLRLVYEHMIG
ncbi:MAG: hypothetical protein ACK4KV_23390 [Rhodocyclaceae bacterium]